MRSAEADAWVGAGRPPIVLVTLYAPGRTFRAASEPVNIPAEDADGPYQYDARLLGDIGFEPEVDLMGLEISDALPSARVEMVLDESVDPAQLELEGGYLSAAWCEVAITWPGLDWKHRRVVLPRGVISGLELGRAGQPIRFAVESIGPRSGEPVIDASRDMGDHYPSSASFTSLEGNAWPVVLGRCYGIPAFKIGDVDPSGGYVPAIALAGVHFADLTVGAAGIVVYEDGEAYSPAGTLTAVNAEDGDGGAVVYVQSSNVGDLGAADGAFTVDTVGGGAHAARGQGAALRADGIVAWLLGRSGAPVDWPGCEGALERLRGWGMGLYLDTPEDALAVLRDRVLPWVPVVERMSGAGIALQYVDPFLDEPTIDLVLGVHLVDRVGALVQVSDPDDLVNEVTIEYAYDHYRRKYMKRVTIGADQNARARVSQQLFGVRGETRSCNVIWQDATAAQSAHWLINRRALPRHAQTYLLEPSLYWLREGTICRLHDEDLGLSGRRAYVRRVNPLLDPPRATIEILPALGAGLGA